MRNLIDYYPDIFKYTEFFTKLCEGSKKLVVSKAKNQENIGLFIYLFI